MTEPRPEPRDPAPEGVDQPVEPLRPRDVEPAREAERESAAREGTDATDPEAEG